MAFIRFTKTGRGYKPKASIWNKGQIGFNQGSVLRFNLKIGICLAKIVPYSTCGCDLC